MVDTRTLNPGDRVRIVDRWPADKSARQNSYGEMDKWLGMVMTVRSLPDENGAIKMIDDKGERMQEDGWYWYPAAIAYVVEDDKFSPASEAALLALLSPSS